MSDAAIRVRGVTKRFGEFVAVSELDFEVPRGCIFGFLGPNGAGKTTTLRMLNDIIAPDTGEIRLLGKFEPGPGAAAHVGYLPEERGLYPKMKVAEMLQFFGELRGLGGREAMGRACAWLERLGISDWKANRVQDLSKGMQQKVQFASALLHDPKILILDEPWSGLDPINADVLRDVVLEEAAKGVTVLFSTHLMEQAEKICEHVCIIARGKKVLDGELSEIKRAASGDRLVALAFSDDGESARAATTVLVDSSLVARTRDRKSHLEVELASGTSGPTLLGALLEAKLSVRRFEIVEPSLHQIFVDEVGEDASARVGERGANA